MAASTAPYRVTVTIQISNPKYYAGSTDPRRSNPLKVTYDRYYFDTLEAAVHCQAINGGTIEQLSASGKSYRRLK